MMKYFDFDFASALHDAMIEGIGGLAGYSDAQSGYLRSTLAQIQNDDYYPSFEEKLAHLFFACVKFHSFADGNKRSALLLTKAFAALNGVWLGEKYYESMEERVIEVAEGKIDKEALRDIFREMINDARN